MYRPPSNNTHQAWALAVVLREVLMTRRLISALVVLVAACSTVPNVPTTPISVPAGLTQNQVQLAILTAITERAPPNVPAGVEITDSVLSAVVTGYHSLNDRRTWYFEDRRPGVIYAGYQRRDWYMRVAVRYDASAITLFIEDSRNLSQSGDRIHKTAIAELQSLENRLRRTLGQMAQANASLQ